MTDARRQAAQELLDAAHRFWQTCGEDRGKWNAVQWLQGTSGELIIFTRGEYRDVLMANIGTLAERDDISYFQAEEMPDEEAAQGGERGGSG